MTNRKHAWELGQLLTVALTLQLPGELLYKINKELATRCGNRTLRGTA